MWRPSTLLHFTRTLKHVSSYSNQGLVTCYNLYFIRLKRQRIMNLCIIIENVECECVVVWCVNQMKESK